MNEATLRLEGDDVVYVNFGNSARVRVVAFFKDKKTEERKVLYADLYAPGGKHTLPRATFEKEFAEALSPAAIPIIEPPPGAYRDDITPF